MSRSRQSSFTVFETITVSTLSVGLTAASIANKNLAIITVESQPVRFRPDGSTTAPTTSVGHIMQDGDILELENLEAMQAVRFIRDGGTDATLSCSYGVG